MDLLHTITSWIDYNRYKALAISLVAVILVYGIGCQSKTTSLTGSGEKVTLVEFKQEASQVQAELSAEKSKALAAIEAYNAKAAALSSQIETGMDDLAEQERIKAELFELAGSVLTQFTTEGGITPASAIGTGIAALALLGGTGALADSRRKDKIIEEQKEKLKQVPTITTTTTPTTTA